MMQAVDSEVSRRKFEREVGHLREIEPTLISRGWWVMSADFPCVKVAFATVGMRPRVIPFAVKADFTDYDVRPLAITFVDPFEDRELAASEMMTHLPRLLPVDPAVPTEVAAQMPPQRINLYQHYPHMPTTPGFLCLPGTRAYHEHPAHSGDSWELHRNTGEGRLFALLETVWRYGTAPIQQFQFAVNVMLGQSEIPA
ncbi:hypothetical protein N2603_37885 [Bradyrhizobium huanghuaihaiense]|uniref:putative metal-binding protein n=1 Tax=Bradyrhizobium huanghuaihaiense TaxID=990078 RepID=UPI0021A9EB0D|nr:putative metal-binding protein [Bradyrhizobium sp. CB3035]UWU75708.1 hypothetical protein N2603_37885 [Bradyrhizobium sp. CB3035]